MYPEILLIESAVLKPGSLPSAKEYLPGYDGQLHLASLMWVLFRLIFALYLLASALARFDRKPLASWEWVARLALAAAIMFSDPVVHGVALAAAVVLIGVHSIRSPNSPNSANGKSLAS
jgi:TRAP-type uncharacterized transport system fused permease subunit